MTDKFNKLHQRISEIVSESPLEGELKHSESVWKLVQKIDGHSSEELQIAALCHDIERGVTPRVLQHNDENYEDYKQRHAKRSSDITAQLLNDFGYSKESVSKVKNMIENHEVGGNEETNVLRDADSVSFFIDNIDIYIKRNTLEKSEYKIKLMYERASERAKKMIKQVKYSTDTQKFMDQLTEGVLI